MFCGDGSHFMLGIENVALSNYAYSLNHYVFILIAVWKLCYCIDFVDIILCFYRDSIIEVRINAKESISGFSYLLIFNGEGTEQQCKEYIGLDKK